MTSPLCFGPYRLDAADATLWHGAERVALAPKCFDLLCLLAGRPGEIIAKSELMAAIWPDTHVGDGTLKVLVRELRAALGDDAAQPRYIETVHRRGYRFVASMQTAATRTAPGRELELATLAGHLARADAGERQVVFVAGEAGIGKTLLVETFVAGLLPTYAVAVGQCLDHFGGGEAYLPILDALTRLGRGPTGDAARQVLRARAPSWMGSLPGWQPAAPRPTGGDTRERMLREMAEALEALSERAPLVLVLEDLHWSDPSTVDLLALLAHRRAPARLLVIATYRPVDAIVAEHRLRRVIHRLTQERLGTELHLGPLPAAAVSAYLRQRLGGAAPPDDLIAAVCERTAGQPLFVVSLVDHLLERRWLEVGAAGAALTVPAERIASELPDGVRELIEQQLAALPAAARDVLAAASLVGDEFAAAAVAAAVAADHQAVEAVCEGEVRRGQFLRALGSRELPDGTLSERYAFAHALQRDVLGRSLASAQRVAVHQRLGTWLEATGAPAAEVARHFHDGAVGGDAAKAVHHSRRAAERARELLAFAEATAHYERALAALAQSPDTDATRADLLIALGEARERNGQLARAAEAFTAAADLARAGAPDQLARAALGLGRGHQLVGRAEPALTALLEEALAALPDGDSRERACLLARLDAALSPVAGAHPRRATLRREAAAMARRLGDVETRLRVLQYARWGFNGDGDVDQLRAAAAELALLAERAADSEQALHLQLLQLGHLAELGDMDAARGLLERFGRRADDAGIPWFRWFTLRLRAMYAMQDGRFADAEHLARAAAALGERMDHPNVRPVLAAQLLALDLLQGRAAAAASRLERYLAQAPAQPLLRAQLAHARLAAGDPDGARQELALLAADDFAAIPRDSVWLAALAHLAEVCAGLGDRRRAAALDALLAPYADRVIGAGSGVASLGHGARYRSLLAATLGRDDDARRYGHQARTAHEHMGARPWLAYTLRDEARLLERADGDGREPRRQARQLADELGMSGLAREVATQE